MTKLPIKAALVAFLIPLASNAAAETSFTCEARTYGHALSAAKGGTTQALQVAKSWIPEKMAFDNQSLRFEGRDPIQVDSFSNAKIRASFRGQDVKGKTMKVVYEITMQSDSTVAMVTMRQNNYRPLGPVVFDCVAEG